MNIIKIVVCLFLILSYNNILLTQSSTYTTLSTANSKALKLYKKGITEIRKGNDNEGLKYLEKALKKEPNFLDAQIEMGGVYYRLGNWQKSVSLLEKAVAVAPDYNVALLYTLGNLKYNLDEFASAENYLKRYIAHPKRVTSLIAKAEKLQKNCAFAKEAIKNPVPFQPKSLGTNINTYGWESLPQVTADGNTLIYTLKLGHNEDFFISKKVNSEWQRGENMGTPINTPDNEGAHTVAPDGRSIIFTACNRKDDGYGSCDLYQSKVENGRWLKPVNIGNSINTLAWESLPSISADGQTLFFSSDRAGGKGVRDLWVSKLEPNGQWGKPKNLGENINTEGDEQAPFIHHDGQTLYFMSNGHAGMGGYDIFVTRKQANGEWGTPQNLGYPINTKSNEGSFFVGLDGKTAYYASDRQEKGSGGAFDKKDLIINSDLYFFELYEAARPKQVTYVKAVVKDAQTSTPLHLANAKLTPLKANEPVTSVMTDEKGIFLICLPIGRDYALSVEKQGYVFHSEHFSLRDTTQNAEKPFLLEVALQRVTPDLGKPIATTQNPNNSPLDVTLHKPIILKNIFFETAKALLRDESLSELDRLWRLLDENPSLNIQINGHTDNVGADADNMRLSDSRAKAVYDYLLKRGIASKRLKYKGFGETKPIATNDTEEGRQQNRRTEFEFF